MHRVSDLFSRVIGQGWNRAALTKQLKKAFHRYPNVFQKSDKTHEEINTSIMKTSSSGEI